MAPVVPDPKRIKSFVDPAAFEAWLAKNHDRAPELWLKIHKKASGKRTVDYAQALDVALCWGWIDGLRKGFDETSFLQRFTPRRPKSVWSQVNRDHVARLIAAGRMTPHGQRPIDAARADGRWDAAYAPMRTATVDTVPADLRAAIAADPAARRSFATLGKGNLFALGFRMGSVKTPAGRARRIASLVAMLARGETIMPEAAGGAAAAEEPPTPPRRPSLVDNINRRKRLGISRPREASTVSTKSFEAMKAGWPGSKKPRPPRG